VEEGFTLTELLLVIVVLGILAGMVIFAVQNLGGESAETACQSDFKTVESALEAYKSEMGNYPSGLGGAGLKTDSDSSRVNAVSGTLGSGGSELLSPSNVLPNAEATEIGLFGPWLRDIPQNGSHYYIWVDNDGSGRIFVGTGTSYGRRPNTATCSAAGVT
jgi:prepilin-type N-terminal cleavage/methylation domain-containing protein